MPRVQIGREMGIKGQKKIAVKNKFMVLDMKLAIDAGACSYILK
jgi:hypothetical protein